MSIKITDLADLIWRDELNETAQTSVPEIAYWLRNNGLGRLNDLIHTSFSIDPNTLEIEQNNFGVEESIILVQLYLIKFFQKQSSDFLGAVGVGDTIEYSENGMTIRKLNRTEQSKVWLEMTKQARSDLKDLVSGYKISKAIPKSIEGEELLLLSVIMPRYNRILNGGN